MPYRVHFGSGGRFAWWAPYKVGPATEVGHGMILSQPARTERADGSWEAHWFGANNFVPSPTNSTLCACEYVGGKGPGHPRVLADYIIATVPNTLGQPLEETCAPFFRVCPANNATALQEMGKPFIEIYSECSVGILTEPLSQALALACCLAAVIGLVTLTRRAVRAHKAAFEFEPDLYQPLAAEEGTAPGGAAAQAEQDLAFDAGKLQRQGSEEVFFDVRTVRQDTGASTAVPDFPWSRASTLQGADWDDFAELGTKQTPAEA